jgi:hypothetical protein
VETGVFGYEGEGDGMKSQYWPGGLRLLCVIMLSATGCTISIAPWPKQMVAPGPAGPNSEQPGSPYGPGMNPPPGSPKAMPPASANISADLMVQFNKQINDLDDQRKTLQDQVYTLRKQLKDREGELQTASLSIEQTTRQVKTTREEFKQWQSEMDELRSRIRTLELDRNSLKTLIEEVLRAQGSEKQLFLTPKR